MKYEGELLMMMFLLLLMMTKRGEVTGRVVPASGAAEAHKVSKKQVLLQHF